MRSSSHTAGTASTWHLSLSPYLLKVEEDGVQGMGSQQPLGAVVGHWAGCSFAAGQAAASGGVCTPVGLELFRF